MKTPQTNKKFSPKKIIVIILVVIGLAVAGFFVWYAFFSDRSSERAPDTQTDDSSVVTEEEKRAAQEKQDLLDEATDENTSSATPDETTSSDQTISFQTRNETDEVVITTNLSSISSGTCKLTITADGDTFTQTAPVIYAPEYSSCAGFSVKKSELAGDAWSIRLDVSSGSDTFTTTASHRVD